MVSNRGAKCQAKSATKSEFFLDVTMWIVPLECAGLSDVSGPLQQC